MQVPHLLPQARRSTAIALDHSVGAAERDHLSNSVGRLSGEQPGVDAAEALADQGDRASVPLVQLGEQPVAHSVVLEVDRLAVALEGMKANLRSFSKYVPADLVRLSCGVEAAEDLVEDLRRAIG